MPTETVEPSTKPLAQQSGIHVVAQQELLHLCRWVPLRLTGKERKMLLLLEGALQISEYTDRVDVARTDYTFYGQGRGWNGQDAIVHEMKDFCRLVVGLCVRASRRTVCVPACLRVCVRLRASFVCCIFVCIELQSSCVLSCPFCERGHHLLKVRGE